MKAVITVTYHECHPMDWGTLCQKLQEAFEGTMNAIPRPNPPFYRIELCPRAECPDLTHDRTVVIARIIREAFAQAGYDQKKKIHVRVEVTDEVVT